MNFIIFFIAILFVVFMFPLFKHMIQDCYMAGLNAKDWVDRSFQWVVMALIGLTFMSIVFSALMLGTMPASSTSWFKL